MSLHPLQGQSQETTQFSAVMDSYPSAGKSRPSKLYSTKKRVVLLSVTDTCLSSNPLLSGCQDLLHGSEKTVAAAAHVPHSSDPHRAACHRCQAAARVVLSWTSQWLASCHFHICHLISPSCSASSKEKERGRK